MCFYFATRAIGLVLLILLTMTTIMMPKETLSGEQQYPLITANDDNMVDFRTRCKM